MSRLLADGSGILALDLSKRNTGWAYYKPGSEKPVHGCWDKLASEYTTDRGQVFYKLYEQLTELHSLMRVGKIFAEDMINILPPKRNADGTTVSIPTNLESIRISAGMAATLEMFAYQIDVPLLFFNQSSWRRHFLGKFARGTRSTDLKLLALQRCKELGFRPKKHDDAEALGVLDYACVEHENLDVPWHQPKPLAEYARAAK